MTIRQYISTRGGVGNLTIEEKEVLVEMAKNQTSLDKAFNAIELASKAVETHPGFSRWEIKNEKRKNTLMSKALFVLSEPQKQNLWKTEGGWDERNDMPYFTHMDFVGQKLVERLLKLAAAKAKLSNAKHYVYGEQPEASEMEADDFVFLEFGYILPASALTDDEIKFDKVKPIAEKIMKSLHLKWRDRITSYGGYDIRADRKKSEIGINAKFWMGNTKENPLFASQRNPFPYSGPPSSVPTKREIEKEIKKHMSPIAKQYKARVVHDKKNGAIAIRIAKNRQS